MNNNYNIDQYCWHSSWYPLCNPTIHDLVGCFWAFHSYCILFSQSNIFLISNLQSNVFCLNFQALIRGSTGRPQIGAWCQDRNRPGRKIHRYWKSEECRRYWSYRNKHWVPEPSLQRRWSYKLILHIVYTCSLPLTLFLIKKLIIHYLPLMMYCSLVSVTTFGMS